MLSHSEAHWVVRFDGLQNEELACTLYTVLPSKALMQSLEVKCCGEETLTFPECDWPPVHNVEPLSLLCTEADLLLCRLLGKISNYGVGW